MKANSAKSNTRIRTIVLGVLGALILVWIGVGGTIMYQQVLSGDEPVTKRETVQTDGNTLATEEETVISSVYEKVSPSVVSIITEVESSNPYYRSALQQGAGTGIIVGKEGYILTNKHVIDGASDIRIAMYDGKTYDDVELLGTDPLNDIAFLKVKGVEELPVANLGDSTTIKIGQRVVAIGNSLGQYQNTVTSGIISGTGRPIAAQAGDKVETLTDLIQTDAAINPGNSGGPLLNSIGQVIGINTAIAEDAEGIGFAIPINAAKGILKQVLAGEEPKRAYLGVRYLPVTAEVATEYKLTVNRGAFVYTEDADAVDSDGPAAKAGIKKGDVITKVGEIEVGERGGVASLVAEYAPGDTIELTVLRGAKTQLIKVTLGAYKN